MPYKVMEMNSIFDKAMDLDPKEKIRLIELLSQSLTDFDEKNKELWKEEAEKRVALLKKNKIRTVKFSEILKQYS